MGPLIPILPATECCCRIINHVDAVGAIDLSDILQRPRGFPNMDDRRTSASFNRRSGLGWFFGEKSAILVLRQRPNTGKTAPPKGGENNFTRVAPSPRINGGAGTWAA